MLTYASTFPAGFKDVIAQAMKYCVPDGKIIALDDGLVVYKSNMRRDRLTKAACFTNTYLVLSLYENILSPQYKKVAKSPADIMAFLSKHINAQTISQIHKARGELSTFRIMAWKDGAPTVVDKRIRETLENLILIKNQYVVNRLKPQSELAFHLRRDGIAFFGMRLTYPTWEEKKQGEREIKPELAYLLCVISQPKESDVVLDPLASVGTIMSTRATYFPYKLIVASDPSQEHAHVIKALHAKLGKNFVIGQMDPGELDEIPDSSVSAIITQLPSSFTLGADATALYRAIFQSAQKALSPSGVLVFCTTEKELTDALIKDDVSLQLHNKWNILINGRKAAVYKLTKRL